MTGFLVYSNSLFNGFVWDDEEQIVNNTAVHSPKNIPNFFSGSTFNPAGGSQMSGAYYKPLMPVCFSIIYSLFGPNPFYFHLFQIILHIINAVLVFYLFRTILKHKNVLLSFFLSLIFLVHPINSEAVIYVSALQDVLFVFFGLIGLNLIVRRPDIRNLALTMGSFLLSVLSKETGLVFLGVGFVYLWFYHKKLTPVYLVYCAIFISFYLILRLGVANVGFNNQALFPIATVGWKIRLLTLPKILFFYLKTFFFPANLAISQHWIVRSTTVGDFYIPLVFDIIFFTAVVLLAIKQYSHIAIFFVLWFIFSLLPHLQIIPLDMTVAERWFYLPIIGLLGLLGAILAGRKINVITVIMVIIVIIGLAGRTIIRTFSWRNGFSLYSHDIEISPDSFDLDNNLGVELVRQGKIDEARAYFERSTKIAPNWWTNWNNLGVFYQRKGDLETAKKYYRKAIDNGDYYLAYENYASVLYLEKNHDELSKFLKEEALVKYPDNKILRQLFYYQNQ